MSKRIKPNKKFIEDQVNLKIEEDKEIIDIETYLIDCVINKEKNKEKLEVLNDKFTSELDSIKTLINKIKLDANSFSNEIDRRELLNSNEKSNKKLEEINRTNTNGIVTLNIGGVEYTISIACLKMKKNTMFYKQILRGIIKNNAVVFYDRDPTYFPYILNFLRFGQFNVNRLNIEQKEELLAEAMFYEITFIVETLKNTGPSLEFIELQVTSPFILQGLPLGNELIAKLNRKQLDKGFLSNPNGEIILKLSKEVTASEIKVAGYNGNPKYWCISNGSDCNMYTSSDKIKWEKVCSLPKNLNHEIKTISFPKTTFTYIKLSHTEYFGVGYFDLVQ